MSPAVGIGSPDKGVTGNPHTLASGTADSGDALKKPILVSKEMFKDLESPEKQTLREQICTLQGRVKSIHKKTMTVSTVAAAFLISTITLKVIPLILPAFVMGVIGLSTGLIALKVIEQIKGLKRGSEKVEMGEGKFRKRFSVVVGCTAAVVGWEKVVPLARPVFQHLSIAVAPVLLAATCVSYAVMTAYQFYEYCLNQKIENLKNQMKGLR